MNTVLIVEDEKLVRQKLKTILQRSGVPIQIIMECNNGQSALDILQEQNVDVMFLNVHMQKTDGVLLVQTVREQNQRPFVIAMSGDDDFSCAVRLMSLGVRDYLLKPLDWNKVNSVLNQLERELEESKKSDYEVILLGHQQLKYLIMNQNMKKEEKEILIHQYRDRFYFREYVICCTNNQNREQENRNYIFLNQIEENEIYIVGEETKDFLFVNELNNRYTGVSKIHHGIEELPEAYQEAKEARKIAFCKGKKLVHFEEKEEEGKPVDSDVMQQVAQMVGTDKINEAEKHINHIIGNIQRGNVKIDSFVKEISVLLDTIKSTYQNVLILKEEEILKYYKIFQFPTIEEYRKTLCDWLIFLHEKISTEFDDYKNKQKIQQAIQYIKENYNKDLNMAVVSNYVSMNYSLFSYTFKQYTGSNFVNYIKEIRMKEAKRLLSNTELLVAEISQTIGYDNEKHFMKTFKNVCGVSPTEYRKNMQFNIQNKQ